MARRSLNQKVDAYYDSLKADLQKQKKSWFSKELTPQAQEQLKGLDATEDHLKGDP